MTRNLVAAILLHIACIAGCSKQGLIDAAMMSAPRPEPPARAEVVVGERRFTLLAGDGHCHVTPPDAPFHVSRDVGAALGLARAERLDFVIFTPHVRARFMADPELRASFVDGARVLDRELRALAATDVLLVRGFEYTDHMWGHVGFAFGDETRALEAAGDTGDPRPFFEAYVASGGVLTLNHPLVLPLDGAPFHEARADMSWRAFTRPARRLPADMGWLTAHAHTIETFNLGVSFLRDRLLRDDPEASFRENHFLLDRQIRAQRRRLSSVAGSDSHGMHLRAVMYVLADARSTADLRRGILAGRTCVRGPEACVAQFRTDGPWQPVGSALSSPRALEIEAPAGATVYVDGVRHDGASVPARAGVCQVVRVQVGRSMSGPTYFNCPFVT